MLLAAPFALLAFAMRIGGTLWLEPFTVARVQLGLGTGAFWDAIAAMHGPRRTPKGAVPQP